MAILKDEKIKTFWKEFLNKFKKDLQIKEKFDFNENIDNIEIQYIKNCLIEKLKKLKDELIDINLQDIKEKDIEFIKKMNDIISYIVRHHPYMSSKFEDIIKLEDNKLIKIKSEALIGNNLLEDDIIKESLISNRYELIEMITKHELMKSIGIELTLKHVETAIYINNKEKHIKNKLSINISEEEIVDDVFYNKLKNIKSILKEKLNMDLSEIIQFELLEYEINFSKDIVWNKLKRLKKLGIDLSIDDFGSNFSNLKRLQDIRLKQEHIEYIRTIKIDKKITSAVSFEDFLQHLNKKKFKEHSKCFEDFLQHLSNIIEIPFLNLKSVLDENIDNDIYDVLFEIEKNYHIKIIDEVKENVNKFNELIEYLKDNDLLKQVNIVFEFIDNEIVKKVIEKISKNTNIEVMAQGYYFQETLKPIYHQDIKEFINIFINQL